MISRRIILIGLAAASLGTTAATIAQAAYPDRPIRLVVPFPPGGPSEVAVRPLADRLSIALGQPVVIENIAGAGGTVGAAHVAAAPADGYTLLATAPGPLVTAAAMYADLAYDPAEAFAPVALLFSSPQLLSVNPSVPASTLAELVAHAKERPGALNFASPGIGTFPHLLGEQLNAMAGIDATHVPYQGGGAAVTAVVAGEVAFSFESSTSVLPQVEGGNLRLVAMAGDERLAQAPDVPTTAEQGFPGLVGYFWVGVLAPAATPPEIVATLNAAISDAVRSPEVEKALLTLAATERVGSPADFESFIEAETVKWTGLIEAIELTP